MVKASYSANEKGEIPNVKILQGNDPSLNAEVIRVIKALPKEIALQKTEVKLTLMSIFQSIFTFKARNQHQPIIHKATL